MLQSIIIELSFCSSLELNEVLPPPLPREWLLPAVLNDFPPIEDRFEVDLKLAREDFPLVGLKGGGGLAYFGSDFFCRWDGGLVIAERSYYDQVVLDEASCYYGMLEVVLNIRFVVLNCWKFEFIGGLGSTIALTSEF